MKSLIGDELTPLAIYMSWGGTNGHYLVVSGYKSSTYQVYLVDPAPNCSSAYYAHYDLVNGTTIQSGTGSYMTTWVPQ